MSDDNLIEVNDVLSEDEEELTVDGNCLVEHKEDLREGNESFSCSKLHNPKQKPWTPSTKQVEAVKLMVDLEVRYTKTEVCQRVGVTRETLYNWLSNENFKQYFREMLHLESEPYLMDAFRCLTKAMKRGNVPAAMKFLELKKMFAPSVKHVLAGDADNPAEIKLVPKFNMPPPPAKRLREENVIDTNFTGFEVQEDDDEND